MTKTKKRIRRIAKIVNGKSRKSRSSETPPPPMKLMRAYDRKGHEKYQVRLNKHEVHKSIKQFKLVQDAKTENQQLKDIVNCAARKTQKSSKKALAALKTAAIVNLRS